MVDGNREVVTTAGLDDRPDAEAAGQRAQPGAGGEDRGVELLDSAGRYDADAVGAVDDVDDLGTGTGGESLPPRAMTSSARACT